MYIHITVDLLMLNYASSMTIDICLDQRKVQSKICGTRANILTSFLILDFEDEITKTTRQMRLSEHIIKLVFRGN